MRQHLALAAFAIATALASPTQTLAQPSPTLIVCNKQGCLPKLAPAVRRARPARSRKALRTPHHSGRKHIGPQRPFMGVSGPGIVRSRKTGATARVAARIVAHPEGCPWHLFCGCGVAARVFAPGTRFVIYAGRRLNLWRAAEWLRFPVARPAPGMVAARNGHVFLIEEVYNDGTVTAYDPNSGGHLTRVHRIGLRGYRVVDPSGGRRLARN